MRIKLNICKFKLCGWILYGKLQDFFDEFFIYKIEKTGEKLEKSNFNKKIKRFEIILLIKFVISIK